ncbi:universal stress protein UspE [Photorhabdus laumondii subsp. laumondii]|uniref:Universal stress protein E n=3 Tax=Photorhabdus TaxID=29487 RepID=USPE_PHOLL|nr:MULTISPECIES: universal stress protein UspE [Photorhabdus]P60005.1 RecName: Full=Universal stress protein E [Photorhabdus laumondii subsp. laumondii TTO1]AWK41963.1 universal stress protein UspE [Photorhabdus laumondii subsp. laumondii]AXG42830.1 universal stress protein E [Photorhabdus laumondii subsp. laumondii]AXG47285.1 universal stress protein E [Photorhabdus laumondii subsp. laumondii]MCC8383744.1 universal stress protein UspE [Photorhabdus laumondii]MCC8388064.1 universal stress pro
MANYQNLLVVIDPSQDDQPALRRAVYIVQRNGGRIKAFLPIYDLSYEMTTLLSPEEGSTMRKGVTSQRTAWLKQQAYYYLEAGIDIEIKVVWHNRPYEAIIQEVITGNHDLLLKMTHKHDKLGSLIFTPLDWQLLRKCPCPVWMVKDQIWPDQGSVVVAVNLSNEESYHHELNLKLVKETQELANQVMKNPEIHLVSAYPVAPLNIAIELPDFNPSVYNHALRGQHLIAMKELRQTFCIDEKYTHIHEGLPESVIPQMCDEMNAGIIVLGILGRTGLSAAFLGNTAEHVIDHLKCDILTIKPDGFECPIKAAKE